MKRHFLAGLMAFCVCAMSLSTVSCGKLEQNINSLQTQVDALSKKLADLETKLNDEVKNLTDAINAVKNQVAVIHVEKKDGVVVLTLADGSKINVAEPDANANNEGLVTTVKEGDKTYWAVVKEDGTVENLGVEVGQKLLFQVDPETYELLVSYDGTEYESTGVLVKDTDTINLVTGFEEGEDYVTFTINGQAYTLPKYDDSLSVRIKAGKTYFEPGETKVVEASVASVNTLVVMSKPDGWKANINGTKLTVTAPSAAAIESGIADVEGTVVLHGNSADGKCQTALLTVSTAEGFQMTVAKDGTISIKNPIVATTTDWMGNVRTDFADAYIGICTVEEFESFGSFEEFFEAASYGAVGNHSYLANVKSNNEIGGFYIPEEYVVDEFEFSIETLANSMWPAYELAEIGGSYVVWAVPQTSEILLDEYVYSYYYTPITVDFSETELSNSDFKATMTLAGANSYYVGMTDAFFEDNGMTIDDFMEMQIWNYFVNGYMEYSGAQVFESGEHEISAVENFWMEPLLPDTKYYFWAIPVIDGRPVSDYTYEENCKPYIYGFKTKGLEAAEEGTYSLEFSNKVATFTSIEYTLTAEDGNLVYYYYFENADDYNSMTESEVVSYLLKNCWTPIEGSGVADGPYGMQPGDKGILVAAVVGADGTYNLFEQPYELPAPTYNADIKITLTSLVLEGTTYTAEFSVEGAEKVAFYGLGAGYEDTVLDYLILYPSRLTHVDVVDGKVTYSTEQNQYKAYLYAVGYNEDENGMISETATTAASWELATSLTE